MPPFRLSNLRCQSILGCGAFLTLAALASLAATLPPEFTETEFGSSLSGPPTAMEFAPDGRLFVCLQTGQVRIIKNGSLLATPLLSLSVDSSGERGLLGKILRINSDGSIPTDNPFYNTASGNNRAIWALGLRNPFTFGFQPGTGRLFIDDVGESTWEEIDDGIAGANYGWPTTEGPTNNPAFVSPIYYYGHGSTDTTGCAIVGGTFYNPSNSQFPSSYTGKYFFSDLCSGWIRVFDPVAGTASGFATGIDTPVDLDVGPDGALYYVARGSNGQVFRVATPAEALNISGRSQAGTGENVAISGFIVTGTASKRVGVRGIGPSLASFGIANPLADPVIQLNRGDGSLVMANDNWKNTQQTEITAAGIAPSNDKEAALIATLTAGNYTAIVTGKNRGTGVGLAEVYDLDQAADSRLANISTRAFVGAGSDVLIGGFITGNRIGATRIAVRALGPSLAQFGIASPLPDPRLQLFDVNGTLLASNDNWQSDANQAALITSYGLALPNNLESAIAISLTPGSYTAIVSGKTGQTGVSLVEIYDEQ